MSKNTFRNRFSKPKVTPAQTTVAARLTVTAFTDRPPNVECTGDLSVTLKLFAAGLQILGNMVSEKTKLQEPVEDKERKYIGPREDNHGLPKGS